MALAKYFSKDLLAINRLINTDQTILEETLNRKLISVAFDENAVNTSEGYYGLDLIIRLLSRLYPKIKVIDLSGKNEEKRVQLINLSKEINSNIEIISEVVDEDIYIIAGYTKKKIQTKGIKLYFGSDNWISKYSTLEVQRFNKSYNPFGSGISACIVASNVFRQIFKSDFQKTDFDVKVDFSAFSLDSETNTNPSLEEIELNDVIIAGIGAIGNGTVWALSHLENLKGKITLVDGETVSLSNIQRYVLFNENDENSIKVDAAKEFFNQEHLNIETCKGNWDDFIKKRDSWNIECVAIGIDNEKDRIGIQSSLPHIIFNSFTEPELIGITRHTDFEKNACLACSYIPNTVRKNRTTEIAENCNIPDKSEMVKDYYNLNKPVNETITNYNESLLHEIALANKIKTEDLKQYKGMTLDQFYSDFICGGTILKLSNTENEINNVDAPLAFQSAIAGILLAAEIVKYHMNTKLKQEIRTDFYHLSPIGKLNPYHRKLEKDSTKRCLCRDDDFVNRYIEKWKNKKQK